MAHNPRHALLAAAVCAAFGFLVWFAAFHSDIAAWFDGTTLLGFMGLRGARVDKAANMVAGLVDPGPWLAWSAALVWIAVMRGRLKVALAVAVIVGGANLTTQLLKPLLAEPRHFEYLAPGQVTADAWPSGHTTAALSLALGLVLVAPARLRPLAAGIGGGFTVAVVYSLQILGWHLPSDVLGGFAVTACWACLGVAALWASDRSRPAAAASDPAGLRIGAVVPTVLAGVAVAAVIASQAIERPYSAVAYADAHTAFVLGAAALGALALALAAAAAAALTSPAAGAPSDRRARRSLPQGS